jgi:hypothetical protein
MVYAHAGWCEIYQLGEFGSGESNHQSKALYSTTDTQRSCADKEQEVTYETSHGIATHCSCSTRVFDL